MTTRTRSQLGTLQYGQTINLGALLLERWDPVTHEWVFVSNTPKSYVVPTTRKYSHLLLTTDELHAGPPYREGGPFDSIMIKDYGLKTYRASSAPVYYGSYRYTYNGSFMPSWIAPLGLRCVDGVKLDEIAEALGDVSSYGPGAYNKFSPVKPKVSLGQFLAEFREMPRMIKQTASFFNKGWRMRGGKTYRNKSKAYANEWLNNQFGWVPFISTIIDTYEATKKLSNTLARLRKYNGQWEKRGGVVQETKSSSLFYSTVGSAYTVPTLSSVFGQSRLRVYEHFEQDVWFEARYKYYLPQLEEMRFPPGVIAQIYGLRITPSLLYQLTPWSWLADWFSSVGDMLKAADDSQYGQLVTRDAYLMGTTQRRYNIQDKFYGLGHAECDYIVRRKQRLEATPYGFGVHSTDLSPWKISILAALGISRSF